MDHPVSEKASSPSSSTSSSSPTASEPVSVPLSIVILRATRDEAPGANLRVAGLTIAERSVKQLARRPGVRVLVVSDGSVALPPRLPAVVELHQAGPDPRATITALHRQWSAGVAASVVEIGADVVRRQGEAVTGGIRVTNEAERRQAEDAIFDDLLRGDLGLIARHLNKKISFRITRYWLCKTPLTPNQVTLGAAAIGLIGCLLIASGRYGAMVAGFVLAQVQSILDGCDGELARVRFQQTAIGEWLDTLVDDFLNFAVVASLGVGLHRAGASWLATTGAAVTCAMLLVYNAVSYRELVRQGVGGELLKIRWKLAPRGIDMKSLMADKSDAVNPLARLFFALGRRDVFVFAWMVLAIVNLPSVTVLWAFLVALSCFVIAVGQLVIPDSTPTSNADQGGALPRP